MAPALDNGSPWYRNRTGVESQTGPMSVELTPGVAPLWRAPVLHV